MDYKAQHFNLAATLECGQTFRFAKDGDGYHVVAGRRRAFITQKGDLVKFRLSDKTDGAFWVRLFDLERDYGEIMGRLAESDAVLHKAARFAPGIRIMNQDPWETLVCFIISANNRIPMIMKVVSNIARRFGPLIGGDVHAMPSPEVLAGAALSDLAACKTGFRGRYILNAAGSVADGALTLRHDPGMNTDRLRQSLMSVKGVGAKIADCVMLFSLERREVFPVDVWIARAMRLLYFGGKDASLTDIAALAKDKFGENAGYANQLIFHYARTTALRQEVS